MKYQILQPLSFYAGALLVLTAEQAHTRRAVLKPLGGDLHEVITEANFKAGEVVGFDGDLPKAMAASAEPVPDSVVKDYLTTESEEPIAAAKRKGRK